MQRISVHIPDDTRRRINLIAQAKNKAEAVIIREALDKGLKANHSKSHSAQALLDFADMAKRIPSKPGSPHDVSINLDYYAWGGEKRKR